ncbi:hypothetical protein [Methylobacterium komagatae]
MPAFVACSRRFAAGLTVVSGDAGARDLVAWMAAVLPAAAACPAGDGSAVQRLSNHTMHGTVATPASVMRIAGIDRLGRLLAGMDRMAATRVRLLGLDGIELPALWRYVAADRPEEAPNRDEDAAAWTPGWLLAEAHIEADEVEERDPVILDLDRMRGMRCRYSPVLHLRAHAWIAGGVKLRRGWRRNVSATGGVAMQVPWHDVGLALGAEWIRSRRDADQLVLTPAIAELADAGVSMSARWVRRPGYDRVYDALVLTVTAMAADKRPRRILPVRRAPTAHRPRA